MLLSEDAKKIKPFSLDENGRVVTAEGLKDGGKSGILRTAQDREWLKRGYDRAVERGDISALTGFEQYAKTAQKIDHELVGAVTIDGVTVTGYKTHFIDQIIGSYEGHREPVSIANAKDALLNGQIKQNRPVKDKPSNVYRTNHWSVSINPDDGILIQVTPKESAK